MNKPFLFSITTKDRESLVEALGSFDIDPSTAMSLGETGIGAHAAWKAGTADPRKAVCVKQPDMDVFVTCPGDDGHLAYVNAPITHVERK